MVQSLAFENSLSCFAALLARLSVQRKLHLPLSYCVIVPARMSMEMARCDGHRSFDREQGLECLGLKVFFKLFLVLSLLSRFLDLDLCFLRPFYMFFKIHDRFLKRFSFLRSSSLKTALHAD